MATATFRKGTDVIRKTAEGKGSRRFTKNIYWKKGDIQTIAWLTEAEEIPKVRLHQMVRVPDDRFDSGIRYETLLCKKDPALGGPNAECDLCDRVGHQASESFVAQAVVLDPVKQGKKIVDLKVQYGSYKREDGSEVEFPVWGIVIQKSKNFFKWFAAYAESQGDIRDVAFEIHREGSGSDTSYHPFVINATLPDFSEFVDEIPALEDLLEEMGSDEKYAEVAGLEAGSQPNPFGDAPKRESGSGIQDRSSEFAKIKDELEDYQTVDRITIITDGSADNRTGSGGYAAIVRMPSSLAELIGWEEGTTSNRMEMTAAIKGLLSVNIPSQIDVVSDSAYLVNTMKNNWYKRWFDDVKKGKNLNRPNLDLWEQLAAICQFHDVKWLKIKGHSGDYWNTRADNLADYARRKRKESVDIIDVFEDKRCENLADSGIQCKLHKGHSNGNCYFTNGKANGVKIYGE